MAFRVAALLGLLGRPCMGAVCTGDPASCEATEDASLLAVHPRRHRSALDADAAKPGVECPGSAGVQCAGNECCPGVAASGGKTFPCPIASRTFQCDAGQEGLVAAMLGAMTRKEKYNFVRGEGWTNGTYENVHGYYIGDAGLGERFGIPPLNMEDNGQGFRTTDRVMIDQVTSWPVTLAITSSWSEKDTERYAKAIGKEFRRKGANVILGPGVNVARVARCGRNAEYISGESPYLGARLVKPYIRGVQSEKVLAVVKHIGNNNQENDRDRVNSIVDRRSMWEVYYPPYEAAVQAGVAVAMCSYNLVNGVHACGSADTLLKDFKGTMGFKGWVQSDWWAVHDFVALEGVDQEMPGTANPNSHISFTDKNLGTLSESKLDSMVRPQLEMMLKFGLFEPEGQVCHPGKCEHQLYKVNATSDEHQALSKELATKAVTLLKNKGATLPIGPSMKKIALLGSACDAKQDVDAQLAQWDLGSLYNIGGSGRVIAWDPVSILAAVTAKCQERGCEIISSATDDVSEAILAAKGADVALICGGTSATEGHDRASLSVDQEDFMVKVAAGLSIPTVSLTMTPAAVVMPWAKDVDAVVNLFMAGKYTGNAFADVLFGDSNPSAKLPVTFPLKEADTVAPCDTSVTKTCKYTEGLFVGFHGLHNREVLFPFGHGLSYTIFGYSELPSLVQGAEMPEGCAGSRLCVRARIENTGTVAGVEVAQLYMGFPEGTGEPEKVLRGFVRLPELQVGESADIAFPLHKRDLQIWSKEANDWVTPDGKYTFFVGSSSRDVRLTQRYTTCNSAVSLDADSSCATR